MISRTTIGLLAMLGFPTLSVAATGAGSELDQALAAGARMLTADEISQRLTDKTVTFVNAADDNRFLIYYGRDNRTEGTKIGGGWSASGFHAITDGDQVCLGWSGSDLPRLRCMRVLLIDGAMHKFKADGSLSGRITAVADGNRL